MMNCSCFCASITNGNSLFPRLIPGYDRIHELIGSLFNNHSFRVAFKPFNGSFNTFLERDDSFVFRDKRFDLCIVKNHAPGFVPQQPGSDTGINAGDEIGWDMDDMVFMTGVVSVKRLSDLFSIADEKHFPKDYVEKISSLTYAYHALGLKVALHEKVTDDQLMMYMPYDYESSIQKEMEKMEGKLPEQVTGMITSPTNYDPSLAPEGKQLIFFGTGCPPKQDWKKWEEVMLHSFYTVYPQARGKVLWHRLDTPDLVNAYAGEEGNIIGVAQTVDQIHERRPSVASPLEGLFFSSAEAGGHGIGAELAADSARELFQVLHPA